MTRHYTPSGVATALVASALVGLFVGVALGSGSVSGLKEWQTLLAAMVALVAAGIAYGNTTRQIAASTEVSRRQRINAELVLLERGRNLGWTIVGAAEQATHNEVVLQRATKLSSEGLAKTFLTEIDSRMEHLDRLHQQFEQYTTEHWANEPLRKARRRIPLLISKLKLALINRKGMLLPHARDNDDSLVDLGELAKTTSVKLEAEELKGAALAFAELALIERERLAALRTDE